jgi:hypothetical protein
LSGGSGGFNALPALVHPLVSFSQRTTRPWLNVGDSRPALDGFMLDNLAQVQPQSAAEQLPLVQRGAARALGKQLPQFFVQADREWQRLHGKSVAQCATEATAKLLPLLGYLR